MKTLEPDANQPLDHRPEIIEADEPADFVTEDEELNEILELIIAGEI